MSHKIKAVYDDNEWVTSMSSWSQTPGARFRFLASKVFKVLMMESLHLLKRVAKK